MFSESCAEKAERLWDCSDRRGRRHGEKARIDVEACFVSTDYQNSCIDSIMRHNVHPIDLCGPERFRYPVDVECPAAFFLSFKHNIWGLLQCQIDS